MLRRDRDTLQQIADLRAGVDHVVPRAAAVALNGCRVVGRNHRSDAGQVVTQGDVPEPSRIERRAEDVAAESGELEGYVAILKQSRLGGIAALQGGGI